jgi:quinol monooxygenase YgiN
MYIITVEFEIDPEHIAAFRETMLLQAKNSLTKETGCKFFDVCFNPDQPSRCFLYEKYDDRAAFDLHLASDHFKTFDTTVQSWVVRKTVNSWHLVSEGAA